MRRGVMIQIGNLQQTPRFSLPAVQAGYLRSLDFRCFILLAACILRTCRFLWGGGLHGTSSRVKWVEGVLSGYELRERLHGTDRGRGE